MREISATQNIEKEWKYDEEKLLNLLGSNSSNGQTRYKPKIIDLDIQEFGLPFFKNCKVNENTYDFKEGHIVQLSKVQNISISRPEEMSQISQNIGSDEFGGKGGKKITNGIMVITVTDGHSKLNILDLVNNGNTLNSLTPPGTKLLLSGVFPFYGGYLFFKKSSDAKNRPQMIVKGGFVESLYEDWKWSITVDKSKRNQNLQDSYPKFHPFGSREIQALIHKQTMFLDKERNLIRNQNYTSKSNSSQKPFNSFAFEAKDKPSEEDTQFNEERFDKISSVKSTKNSNGRREYPSIFQIANQFMAGGSKFYNDQNEKKVSNDQHLSEIVSHGYSLAQAKNALNINKQDVSMALSYLERKSTKEPDQESRVRGRGRGRGRGGGRGGRFHDKMDQESRLPPKETGFIDLGSLINELDRIEPKRPAPSQAPQRNGINFNVKKFESGTPILAESMGGNFKPAILWGWDPNSPNRELILISFDGSNFEDSVGIKHLRTIDGKNIDPERIPHLQSQHNTNYQSQDYSGNQGNSRGSRNFNHRGNNRGHRRGGRSHRSGPRRGQY